MIPNRVPWPRVLSMEKVPLDLRLGASRVTTLECTWKTPKIKIKKLVKLQVDNLAVSTILSNIKCANNTGNGNYVNLLRCARKNCEIISSLNYFWTGLVKN